ncbi:unnamed protein product [Meloidogyne enterolobii]|uniref:Uncharacterized protein n=1 Tax=Meloidogyne enterolobii TaxID=390850 RepID=A0ACB0ZGK4_MELEN
MESHLEFHEPRPKLKDFPRFEVSRRFTPSRSEFLNPNPYGILKFDFKSKFFVITRFKLFIIS